MRITELKVFLSILETGSLASAGRLQNLTQPAVSSIIKNLEQEVGNPLLERHAGQRADIEPTPSGKIFRDYALKAIEDYSRMLLEVAQNCYGIPTVKVVASPTLGGTVMPVIINHFRKEYPSVKILSYTPIDYPDSDLRNTDFSNYDIGLSPVKPQDDSKLVYEPFFYDPIVPICPLSMELPDTISKQQFTSLPIVTRGLNSKIMDLVIRNLSRSKVDFHELNTVMQVNGNADVLQAVSMGSGAGFISRALYDMAGRNKVRLLSIKGVSIDRNLYLVHRKGYEMSTAARLLYDYAKGPSWRGNFNYDTLPR